MTAAVGARNLSKVDASVVHALMQARYQNPSRGQFLSEDPVFISTMASQPPMIADELRRQADVFTDLVELQSKLGRDPPFLSPHV